MAEHTPLSERQRKVLRALASLENRHAMFFGPIARKTKMNKREVRLACRALARKELAEHITGLIFDGGPKDGMLAGSGYGITNIGRNALAKETT